VRALAEITQEALELAIDLDGEEREFRIKVGSANAETYRLYTATVLWLTDRLQAKALADATGLVTFVSDVGLVIRASDIPRLPRPGELLYSPRNQAYVVVASNVKHRCYIVLLNRARSNSV
jgi:hypothetical protein